MAGAIDDSTINIVVVIIIIIIIIIPKKYLSTYLVTLVIRPKYLASLFCVHRVTRDSCRALSAYIVSAAMLDIRCCMQQFNDGN